MRNCNIFLPLQSGKYYIPIQLIKIMYHRQQNTIYPPKVGDLKKSL